MKSPDEDKRPWSLYKTLNIDLSCLHTNQQMELMTSVSPTTTATENIEPPTNMHVGIAQNPMHLADPPAPPRTPYANHVAE